MIWLAKFDLISRIHGLITTARYNVLRRRRHHKRTRQARGADDVTFIPPDSGSDCEQMLRRYGVPCWDRRIVRSEKPEAGGKPVLTLAMKVPASQVKWARYLLACHGAALDGSRPQCAPQSGPMPTPWSARSRTSRQTISKTRRAIRRIQVNL